MSSSHDQAIVVYALKNWRALCEIIESLTIPDLRRALEIETHGKRRKSFLTRITAKILQIERAELMKPLARIQPKPRRGGK